MNSSDRKFAFAAKALRQLPLTVAGQVFQGMKYFYVDFSYEDRTCLDVFDFMFEYVKQLDCHEKHVH